MAEASPFQRTDQGRRPIGVDPSNNSLARFYPAVIPAELRDLVLAGPAGSTFTAAAEPVPVESLVLADSPRLSGEDDEHVQRLVGLDVAPPPILVHRATMRVIDGRHRLRAAVQRGDSRVNVVFFDGPERYVFALAVAANVRHGLPLSLADREAAAVRLIAASPVWSDRVIAITTGLSARTVAAIRRDHGGAASARRLGRDGRIRPVDPVPGRRMASDIIARRPDASLREIAKAAGISLATARDVRLRMQRGDSIAPSGPVAAGSRDSGRRVRRPPTLGSARAIPAPDAVWQRLRDDPSLRFTDAGRTFLRWFLPRVAGPRGWREVAGNIPPHCKYAVASLAMHCAEEWQRFAEQMERQADSAT